MNNGKTVKSANQWWKKRKPEILKDLQEQMYGKIPEEADLLHVKWSVTVIWRLIIMLIKN
jgi:hypothetical protein